MNTKVSVIMLNWNTPEMTFECVQSVKDSDYSDFTINVIDNGSTKENFKLLETLLFNIANLTRIEENCGYVGGMNHALKIAAMSNPRYILIMNNDTIIDQKSISALVKTSQKHEDKCVVTGKVFHFDDPKRLQTVGNTQNLKSLKSSKIGRDEIDTGQYDHECERDMIDDIFMLLPLQVFLSVGGYNPYFYLNAEQADLIIRIKKAGYKVIYTPDAKIYHKGSFSTGGLGNPYMMYWDGKSSMVFHFLHSGRIRFVFYVAESLIYSIYSLAKVIVNYSIGGTQKRNVKARYARFLGILAGIFWSFNPKAESGYNPFQPKT